MCLAIRVQHPARPSSKKELEIMEEQIHRHVNDRPDSITIGTPSKGGELKVYFNAEKPAEAEALLVNAFAIRDSAQKKYAAQGSQ
jgi:hypothetical protein